MKKTLALLLVFLMAFAVMTGCAKQAAPANPAATQAGDKADVPAGEAATGPIKIVYWHTLTDHHEETLLKCVGDFNASQDKYIVVAEQQPYSEMNTKLLQAVSNGVGPDVVGLFPTDAAQYVEAGYLYDFAEFINDPEIGIPNYKERYPQGVRDQVSFGDDTRVFLFPDTCATGEVLYYNKTMFDELGLTEPKTWTELENCAKAIYEKYGVAGFGSDSITDTYQTLIMQAGSSYIDPEAREMAIDREIGIEKLNWFANGCKAGYFRLVGEDFYFSNPFGSQAVGMYIGSSAGLGYVYAAIPEEGSAGYFEFGVCPIPQEGPVKYISNWSGGYACLSTDAAHARGTYEFVKFLTSVERGVESVLSNPGNMPLYTDISEDPRVIEYIETDPATKAMIEQYQYLGYLPCISGSQSVRTEIDKMVQTVALNVADAETAFDAMVEACRILLND